MRTPLGPFQTVLIERCAHFRGCFICTRCTFGIPSSVRITVDVRISKVSARRSSTVAINIHEWKLWRIHNIAAFSESSICKVLSGGPGERVGSNLWKFYSRHALVNQSTKVFTRENFRLLEGRNHCGCGHAHLPHLWTNWFANYSTNDDSHFFALLYMLVGTWTACTLGTVFGDLKSTPHFEMAYIF